MSQVAQRGWVWQLALRAVQGILVLASGVIAGGLFQRTTVWGKQIRIGNLSFVSHNILGGPPVIGLDVMVSGDAKIGENVTLGPRAMLSDGVRWAEAFS